MRKFISFIGACCMLALASCTPDITEIQRITTQVCGFVPTAVVISNMFPNPYTTPASVIAQAICTAVATQVPLSARRQMARRGAAAETSVTINVGGEQIKVTGYFIR